MPPVLSMNLGVKFEISKAPSFRNQLQSTTVEESLCCVQQRWDPE